MPNYLDDAYIRQLQDENSSDFVSSPLSAGRVTHAADAARNIQQAPPGNPRIRFQSKLRIAACEQQ
jgi:hypothetical protein